MKIFTNMKKAIENRGNGVMLSKDVDIDGKTIKNFCIFKDYQEIVTLLSDRTKQHHWSEIYEPDNKCHFVLDSDITDEAGREDPILRINSDIDTVKMRLVEYCKLQGKDILLNDINTIILKSPSTAKKDSFHVIFKINGVLFNDILVQKNFYDYMTITKKDHFLSIDKSLYSKNHQLRTIFSSKIKFPENTLEYYGEPPKSLLDTFGSYTQPLESDFILQKTSVKAKETKSKKRTL